MIADNLPSSNYKSVEQGTTKPLYDYNWLQSDDAHLNKGTVINTALVFLFFTLQEAHPTLYLNYIDPHIYA